MSISARERRLVFLVAPALLIALVMRFGLPDGSAAPSGGSEAGNIALAEQRVARMRQIIATTPARTAAAKQVRLDLAERERGILQADTAPQAQALLLEIARRVGKSEDIDVRGGDFGAPKPMGEYGLVYTTVTFECRVEQLVNFLADLSKQSELIVPSEERITTTNAKLKMMSVRMVLAGVTLKKLIPEKKGFAAF
ncbi:MAG: hypothetical protein JWN34_2100 [Bryobacterales bacterium]|nr:hypothetical protein [Bryobacterales bacterium]